MHSLYFVYPSLHVLVPASVGYDNNVENRLEYSAQVCSMYLCISMSHTLRGKFSKHYTNAVVINNVAESTRCTNI